jgi:UDP-N-acetylglucosamine--N-acetylmuramyl-(pentapeptide) pyrophosphoryl-undecaprenol N-acetylglucosamine transferase
MHITFSPKTITNIFKMAYGCVIGLWKLFRIYPDVVFAKGAYASFPTLLAARILGIPVVIHESDVVPGRVTKWASKFAKAIAISYTEAEVLFPPAKTAWTGLPIRTELRTRITTGAHEAFGLDPEIPVLLILGGSLGAQRINECILQALPQLVEKFQIIHQTGQRNFSDVSMRAKTVLVGSAYSHRYIPKAFLNVLEYRQAGSAATVIITRAGSALFEIASWHVPSIIIPISVSHGDHQRKNAYAFQSMGAGVVMEEANLTPTLLIAELNRFLGSSLEYQAMVRAAETIGNKDAARLIAQKMFELAKAHSE